MEKKNYYERNKFECCKKRLEVYLPKSISRVKELLGKDYETTIESAKQKYPFKTENYEYAKSFLKRNKFLRIIIFMLNVLV